MASIRGYMAASLDGFIADREGGDVWIVGGSRLQCALIELEALDRLELFLIPVLLGEGVPLFRPSARTHALRLDATEAFDLGLVRLDYGLRPAR